MNYIATIKTLNQGEFDQGNSPSFAPDGSLLYVHIAAADEHEAYRIASEYLKTHRELSR